MAIAVIVVAGDTPPPAVTAAVAAPATGSDDEDKGSSGATGRIFEENRDRVFDVSCVKKSDRASIFAASNTMGLTPIVKLDLV